MTKVGASMHPVIAAATVVSAAGYGITLMVVAQMPGAILDFRIAAIGAVAQALLTPLAYVVAAKVRR